MGSITRQQGDAMSNSSPADQDPIVIEATVIDSDGSSKAPDAEQEDLAGRKSRGAKQMLAGGLIATLGVPMLILPGPGVAAIAGGLALAGRGYHNLTGNEVLSEETRQDHDFIEGQEAGERFAQRMRDFASDELAPAGAKLAEDLKDAGSAAAHGIKDAAEVAADVVGKGARAAVGDEAAQKAAGFASRTIGPAVEAAASFGRGVAAGLKPHVAKAAQAGTQAAANATQKLADKASDLMR